MSQPFKDSLVEGTKILSLNDFWKSQHSNPMSLRLISVVPPFNKHDV